MSIPDNSAARNSESTQRADSVTEPTFEEQVNSVVKQLKQSDKGVWELPDDVQVADQVKYAAGLEKRRRDTESALGKTRLQLKTEEELRKKLEARAAAGLQLDMSQEEAEALEELQAIDPNAWRLKVNELEQKATTAFQEELNSDRSSISQQAELERRTNVLEQFNMSHPDAPITDETLASEIPPRITKKLEAGTITFEDFLTEAYEFVTRPTTTVSAAAEELPNLGNVGGGSAVSDEAKAGQELADYSKTTF